MVYLKRVWMRNFEKLSPRTVLSYYNQINISTNPENCGSFYIIYYVLIYIINGIQRDDDKHLGIY